jgi:hypothetical protein
VPFVFAVEEERANKAIVLRGWAAATPPRGEQLGVRFGTEPAHAPLHVGLNPYAVATDGHSVWVTGLADNRVTRIATGA